MREIIDVTLGIALYSLVRSPHGQNLQSLGTTMVKPFLLAPKASHFSMLLLCLLLLKNKGTHSVCTLESGSGLCWTISSETVLVWAGEMAQWEDWSLDPQKGMWHSKCCPSIQEAEMGYQKKLLS